MSFNIRGLVDRIFFAKKEISQREFGEFLGISEKTISKWKKDYTSPTIEQLEIIRKKLELDWEYLMTGYSYNPKVIVNAYFPVLVSDKVIKYPKKYTIAKSIITELVSCKAMPIEKLDGLYRAAWIYLELSKGNKAPLLSFDLLGAVDDSFEECARVASEVDFSGYDYNPKEFGSCFSDLRDKILSLSNSEMSFDEFNLYSEVQSYRDHISDLRQLVSEKEKRICDIEYHNKLMDEKIQLYNIKEDVSLDDKLGNDFAAGVIADLKAQVEELKQDKQDLRRDKDNLNEQINLLREKLESISNNSDTMKTLEKDVEDVMDAIERRREANSTGQSAG